MSEDHEIEDGPGGDYIPRFMWSDCLREHIPGKGYEPVFEFKFPFDRNKTLQSSIKEVCDEDFLEGIVDVLYCYFVGMLMVLGLSRAERVEAQLHSSDHQWAIPPGQFQVGFSGMRMLLVDQYSGVIWRYNLDKPGEKPTQIGVFSKLGESLAPKGPDELSGAERRAEKLRRAKRSEK